MNKQPLIDVTIKGIKRKNVLGIAVMLLVPNSFAKQMFAFELLKNAPSFEEIEKLVKDTYAEVKCKDPQCDNCIAQAETIDYALQLIKQWYDARESAKSGESESFAE